MNTFVGRARMKNVYMHLIHCRTGAGHDYERDDRRMGLIVDADSILLAFIFRVGPELCPGRVITGAVLNAESSQNRAITGVALYPTRLKRIRFVLA
ncbi:unnamed protein product [Heligmosomoides polygyrus]|uniref:Cytochrome P450 n=1 Tax=Heligmosomoides polygyrus TaxID=6339 RepID=A0A183FH88_HELPZ|nr:unnamed protein product [Heligmosomoides polygyrus]